MSILDTIERYSFVLMVAVFALIIATTYWPSRKNKIEQQGRIPFEDDV